MKQDNSNKIIKFKTSIYITYLVNKLIIVVLMKNAI